MFQFENKPSSGVETIYFLFYSFVYFFIDRLAIRINLPLYDFVLITTGRPGTTQRFVAVDLLIFFILFCHTRGLP